jgi:hypothetical protein
VLLRFAAAAPVTIVGHDLSYGPMLVLAAGGGGDLAAHHSHRRAVFAARLAEGGCLPSELVSGSARARVECRVCAG